MHVTDERLVHTEFRETSESGTPAAAMSPARVVLVRRLEHLPAARASPWFVGGPTGALKRAVATSQPMRFHVRRDRTRLGGRLLLNASRATYRRVPLARTCRAAAVQAGGSP